MFVMTEVIETNGNDRNIGLLKYVLDKNAKQMIDLLHIGVIVIVL